MNEIVRVASPVEKVTAPGRSELQQFENGAFHRWYNFILGYSDQLVTQAFKTLDVANAQRVFDPFCGSGTTLVEAAQRGLPSIGIDANPFAVFAARVKTRFSLSSESLLASAEGVERRYKKLLDAKPTLEEDPTYLYLRDSGMIERGWISPEPLRKALALKKAIEGCRKEELHDTLLLALVADLPHNIGNMKFGPQIYKATERQDVDPLPRFRARVESMALDLDEIVNKEMLVPSVVLGDARSIKPALRGHFGDVTPPIDVVICSPPYPTEHDYTRHTRLELAFLNEVTTRASLRQIKRTMIRSHTKGIYKDDDDAHRARNVRSVETLAAAVERAIEGRESGFEKLYPTVVRAYFGGMRRHFISLYRLLQPGAKAAYVVGDQAAYARVHIHTAKLLADVAQTAGFKVDGISVWRERWSTGIGGYLDENILYLSKPL